jgi:protein transport protein SEC24
MLTVGGKVSSDMRIHSLRLLRGLGATDLIAYLYPRIFSLHTLSEQVCIITRHITHLQDGFADKTGQLVLPPLVRASKQYLDDSGAYLLGIEAPLEYGIMCRKWTNDDFVYWAECCASAFK